MKYNCHQIHCSAGIPAVSVCLGNLCVFQLWQFIHRQSHRRDEQHSTAVNHSYTHTFIWVSTHLSQGHVVMIPPRSRCLCGDVWTGEVVQLGLEWADNVFSPDMSSVQLLDDLLLDFFIWSYIYWWVYIKLSHLMPLKGEQLPDFHIVAF